MSERLRALGRIRSLQDQVKRLSEAELAAADARRLALEREADALRTMIEAGAFAGALGRLASRRQARLAREQAQAQAEAELKAEETREARRRAKLAERRVEDLGAAERSRTERAQLERLVDAIVARPGAAPS